MTNENIATVLVVEDDKRLSHINCHALKSEGYETLTAHTLSEARETLKTVSPDVILLDVKLPDGTGFELCREIRDTTYAYIIFLTSVTEPSGEMEGLVAGGDDYLRKPYAIELLCERVKKGLRQKQKPQIIRRGSLTLDVTAGTASIGNTDLLLSPRECSLLQLFIQNEEKVLSSAYIYETIWKLPMYDDNNAVKSAVKRLRKKLEGCGYTVTAEYKSGYRFGREL